MGLIRSLIQEVKGAVTGGSTTTTQPSQSSQSRSRRVSESESDIPAATTTTTSSGRRKSDSGRTSSPGLVRGTIKYATDTVTGTKPPQHRQERVDGEHVATKEDVTKALELVTSAVADLQLAVDGLHKRGGIVGAAKLGYGMATSSSEAGATTANASDSGASSSSVAAATTAKQTSLPAPGAKGSSTAEGEEALLVADATAVPATQSGWAKTGEVLKTVGHDGRIPADKLILDAHNKYEAAADLVDGMPEIDMAQSNAPALGKLAAPLGGAAQIAMLAVGAGAAAFGIIHRVIKRKRTKKAAASVEDMLAEYEAVRLQLESLDRAGRGGMLQPYAVAAAAAPLPSQQQQQQYSHRPPVHPPQPTPQYNAAYAVGVPVNGGAPPPQYGYTAAAQQYPQYAAPAPQQYQQQQYSAPQPYQQQQYGAPPPQQYQQQQQQQQYGAPPQAAYRQPLPDLL